MAMLEKRMAKFHADYVSQYVDRLDCPVEQKLELLDAIAQTILDGCGEDSENQKERCE